MSSHKYNIFLNVIVKKIRGFKMKALTLLIVFTQTFFSYADNTEELPIIPETGFTVLEASKIRDELLLLRQDVESKIQRLKEQKNISDEAQSKLLKQKKELNEEKRLFNESITKEKNIREERIAQTVKFFDRMDPKKAAAVVSTLDKDLVTKIFLRLKTKRISDILSNMNPKTASDKLEYFTKIRSGREFSILRKMGLCEQSDIDKELGKKE